MSEVLVYTTYARAATARTLLAAACQATGLSAQLELYGTGSLYQRLGPRHAPPLPDVVLWFGAFAAQAAALDGLLQPYQPPRLAPAAAHHANWHWTALDYLTVGTVGTPALASLADVLAIPPLAVPDPERSEVGLSMLLAMLDRARQVDGDVERGWTWWQQRARAGLVLVEEDAEAVSSVADGATTHALTLADNGTPLVGLAPLPNAVSLAASSRNVDAARQLLDWLTGDAAASSLRLSPWDAERNGLQALLAAGPQLDVEWARQQYTPTRKRWSQSGFGPSVKV
jgi:ABC-type Fe3+ transport system substrate-binding protein